MKKGETVGIIGVNGAGKSTILKIITGVVTPDRGEVTVNGRISALLELGTGFQPEFTGMENIYNYAAMAGVAREEIEAKIPEILEFAEIGDFIYQPVKVYSSGMFVRLAFALAIHIDPEILIVDEALSVGDMGFTLKCFRKFEEFQAAGKTILFVSHDMNAVRRYCDRVILLADGRVVGDGPAREMIAQYKRSLTTQSALVLNPNAKKTQTGEVDITTYSILDADGIVTQVIESGRPYTIRMKVTGLSPEDTENVAFGYSMATLKGLVVTGTVKRPENAGMKQDLTGAEWIVEFTQTMHLVPMEYLLTLFVKQKEQQTVTWEHVTNLTVISDRQSAGYYDMEAEVAYGMVSAR